MKKIRVLLSAPIRCGQRKRFLTNLNVKILAIVQWFMQLAELLHKVSIDIFTIGLWNNSNLLFCVWVSQPNKRITLTLRSHVKVFFNFTLISV